MSHRRNTNRNLGIGFLIAGAITACSGDDSPSSNDHQSTSAGGSQQNGVGGSGTPSGSAGGDGDGDNGGTSNPGGTGGDRLGDGNAGDGDGDAGDGDASSNGGLGGTPQGDGDGDLVSTGGRYDPCDGGDSGCASGGGSLGSGGYMGPDFGTGGTPPSTGGMSGGDGDGCSGDCTEPLEVVGSCHKVDMGQCVEYRGPTEYDFADVQAACTGTNEFAYEARCPGEWRYGACYREPVVDAAELITHYYGNPSSLPSNMAACDGNARWLDLCYESWCSSL